MKKILGKKKKIIGLFELDELHIQVSVQFVRKRMTHNSFSISLTVDFFLVSTFFSNHNS